MRLESTTSLHDKLYPLKPRKLRFYESSTSTDHRRPIYGWYYFTVVLPMKTTWTDANLRKRQ